MSVPTKTQLCPYCSYGIDTASLPLDPDNDLVKPKAGDASICLKCSEIMIFADSDGTLRKAEQSDIDRFKKDLGFFMELVITQEAVRKVRAEDEQRRNQAN